MLLLGTCHGKCSAKSTETPNTDALIVQLFANKSYFLLSEKLQPYLGAPGVLHPMIKTEELFATEAKKKKDRQTDRLKAMPLGSYIAFRKPKSAVE